MKILILDDHALFREGLHYTFQVINPEIELLQAESFEQARDIIEKTPELNLLLIDLEMPVIDGFEALDAFTTLFPTLPCVILSASSNRGDVNKAIQGGALGFISKNTQGESLNSALKLILSGEIYVPFDIMHVDRRINRNESVELTKRQREVMSLVVKGLPNKLIADKLDLAEATVKMHLAAIFEKLGVHNRSAAIAEVSKHKLALPMID